MPITKHQLTLRRKHLGASDAPAILGLSPWKTRAEVYWSKVLTPEIEDSQATDAMETGNRLERPLLDYAAEEMGLSLLRNQFRVSWHPTDDGILCANLDALVVGKSEAVEAKYVGPGSADQWGQPGTDEVPEYVIAQVQHQMYVAGLDRVWIAAAIARRSLEWAIYCVQRHQGLIDAIVKIEVEFWQKHVVPLLPPDDHAPPLLLLKSLRREPQSVVELDEEARLDWEALQELRKQRKIIEVAEEDAYATILGRLAEAEAGLLPDGRMLTYFAQRGKPSFDTAQFRAKHPELWAMFSQETQVRVLRERKAAQRLPLQEGAV